MSRRTLSLDDLPPHAAIAADQMCLQAAETLPGAASVQEWVETARKGDMKVDVSGTVLERIRRADVEDLANVPLVGQTRATTLRDGLASVSDTIDGLLRKGVRAVMTTPVIYGPLFSVNVVSGPTGDRVWEVILAVPLQPNPLLMRAAIAFPVSAEFRIERYVHDPLNPPKFGEWRMR